MHACICFSPCLFARIFAHRRPYRRRSQLGNKWAKIAERLPGRTEHAIRNRYARLQSLALRGNPIVLSSGQGLPIGIQLVPGA